jgi:hypothetical protein
LPPSPQSTATHAITNTHNNDQPSPPHSVNNNHTHTPKHHINDIRAQQKSHVQTSHDEGSTTYTNTTQNNTQSSHIAYIPTKDSKGHVQTQTQTARVRTYASQHTHTHMLRTAKPRTQRQTIRNNQMQISSDKTTHAHTRHDTHKIQSRTQKHQGEQKHQAGTSCSQLIQRNPASCQSWRDGAAAADGVIMRMKT